MDSCAGEGGLLSRMSLEPYTSFGIFDVAGISLAKLSWGVTHYAVWASAEHKHIFQRN